MSVTTPTRRDRARAAAVEEIKASARALLVEQGPHAVSLRAIAREMGMTAPGLYRYFASHEDLMNALVTDLYLELTVALETARDAVPAQEPSVRVVAMARAFRAWATGHPREFGLIFAAPLPAVPATDCDLAGHRFAAVFASAFLALWQAAPFPVEADHVLPAALAAQLVDYRDGLAEQVAPEMDDLPLGAVQAFLGSWVRLFGVVSLEIMGHLSSSIPDAGPFFEHELAAIGAVLGLRAPDA